MSLEKYEIPLDYEFCVGDKVVYLKKSSNLSTIFRKDVEYLVKEVSSQGRVLTLQYGTTTWSI